MTGFGGGGRSVVAGAAGFGAGFFSPIVPSFAAAGAILPLPDVAALATLAVQLVLVGAALALGAIVVRDLWREVRR